jgi:hypothetical protein
MGGKCLGCGCSNCLQIHLKVSDGGRHHDYDATRRQCFYLEEFKKGNAELRCSDCHARITAEETARVRVRNRIMAGLCAEFSAATFVAPIS